MKTVEIIIVFLISIVMGIAIGFFAAKMMPSGGPSPAAALATKRSPNAGNAVVPAKP